MGKRANKLAVCLFSALVLAACSSGAMQAIEGTRSVPQPIEVTMIIPHTVLTTQVVKTTGIVNPEAAIPTAAELQSIQDTGYYDGIIVITQYYTFLGHGLYKEAYQLLSLSARSHSLNLEDYVNMAKLSFKTVEIVTIVPYYVAIEQQGGQAKPDPQERKRFAVQIKAWGEGKMSGSVESGSLQMLFLTLVQESGIWKIDSFSTAPLP